MICPEFHRGLYVTDGDIKSVVKLLQKEKPENGESFFMVGLDNLFNGRPDLRKALKGIPKKALKTQYPALLPDNVKSKLSDYKGSGYDRGHMAASATVDSSYNAMTESFLLSNMTPQLPGLNRQGWRYLEQYIRKWTNERGELYVVTGAMFEGKHTVIGNGVHEPTHFYKIVFDSAGLDAIAFLVAHRAISKGDLSAFIVSVDEIEALTGWDFNNLLDDAVEDDIEDDVVDVIVIRKRVIFSLLIVTPLGFFFKFYSGSAHWWFNNYGAGLLYEVFWILIVFFFFPNKKSVNTIPVWVLAITCVLEVLQIWHPWFLEKIRSFFLGKALIGTTFVWWDFPHYIIGCLIGWVWIKKFLISKS